MMRLEEAIGSLTGSLNVLERFAVISPGGMVTRLTRPTRAEIEAVLTQLEPGCTYQRQVSLASAWVAVES